TARRMVRELRRKLDAQFRVGIGSVRRLNEAETSYMEAMNSIRLSTGSVAHVKDLPIGCDYEEDYPVETERALLEKTEQGDVSGALVQAGRFFDWMTEAYPDAVIDIKLKALEMVLWVEHISYESGGMTYHFTSRHDYLPTILEIREYEELRTWFVNKIQEACRNIATKKEKSSDSIVSRAKDYIKAHFGKDISLDDVSREVNISPYYFSKLFKEETGENFIEYVTAVRMEKAKELLTGSDKSMKEIGLEVGYADPNYFSRTFKKNLGVTPTEYKEGKR
ncbi:MAG: helix-turn-helix transcriptional regulator, partial [Lachnospiraceae bacterium]|nr:helix-turn-helix transcriptional regulator [Lachnospiraceae bacterium]